MNGSLYAKIEQKYQKGGAATYVIPTWSIVHLAEAKRNFSGDDSSSDVITRVLQTLSEGNRRGKTSKL
jgi:hypothetical protein